jgi:hypothetical protein
VHFNSLLDTDPSDWSVWPAVTIAKPTELNTNNGAMVAYIDKGVPAAGWTCSTTGGCKVFVDGASGALWNYGDNFGGPTKSTWTSGANTNHGAMPKTWSYGVVDSGYGSSEAGTNSMSSFGSATGDINSRISMCTATTSGANCRG